MENTPKTNTSALCSLFELPQLFPSWAEEQWMDVSFFLLPTFWGQASCSPCNPPTTWYPVTAPGPQTVGIFFLFTYRNILVIQLRLMIRPIRLASWLPQTVDILAFYGQCTKHMIWERGRCTVIIKCVHIVLWLVGWLTFWDMYPRLASNPLCSQR